MSVVVKPPAGPEVPGPLGGTKPLCAAGVTRLVTGVTKLVTGGTKLVTAVVKPLSGPDPPAGPEVPGPLGGTKPLCVTGVTKLVTGGTKLVTGGTKLVTAVVKPLSGPDPPAGPEVPGPLGGTKPLCATGVTRLVTGGTKLVTGGTKLVTAVVKPLSGPDPPAGPEVPGPLGGTKPLCVTGVTRLVTGGTKLVTGGTKLVTAVVKPLSGPDPPAGPEVPGPLGGTKPLCVTGVTKLVTGGTKLVTAVVKPLSGPDPPTGPEVPGPLGGSKPLCTTGVTSLVTGLKTPAGVLPVLFVRSRTKLPPLEPPPVGGLPSGLTTEPRTDDELGTEGWVPPASVGS